MHTKANPYHVQFGSASNFETILTLQQVDSPTGTTELKFDTLFANAKNALARQTKARFYLTKNCSTPRQADISKVEFSACCR